jgi:carboxypeptidase PM20D1
MARRPASGERWIGLGGVAAALWIGLAAAAAGTAGAQESASPEAIARRLAGAIRFETISHEDPAEFDAAAFEGLTAYLESQYPRAHAALERERIHEHTLLFRWPGSDPALAPALFMAHLDVVPVEDAALAEWTHPPFAGVVQDGFVWGRGALDVKSGVILWLEAIEALVASGFTPERTLYLSLGHDEEIGGFEGAAAVARTLRERGVRLAFLFDEGGFVLDGHPLLPDRTLAFVVTAEKHYYVVDLTTRGVSGHSSMPPPSTAIGRLARAIVQVEENPMPTRLTQPVRDMFAAVAPYVSWGRRLAFDNLWLTSGLVKAQLLDQRSSAPMVRTTLAATLISGGVKNNVIPEHATASLNVRILPGDTPEDVIAHLRDVIDDPAVEIEGTSWGAPPPPASPDGPAFAVARDAVLEVWPDAVVMPGLIPGTTDSRHFKGVADEILRFVPQRLHVDLAGGAHGRDERLAVAHLADSVAVAIGMLRRAGAPAMRE